VGIIPYYSGLPTIDMWGLNDLHIAHKQIPDMGQKRPMGHEKTDPIYAFQRRPTYFLDEFHYLLEDSIPNLRELVYSRRPEVHPYLTDYRVRMVPLMLDLGQGERRYWFNYLEHVGEQPAVPATADSVR